MREPARLPRVTAGAIDRRSLLAGGAALATAVAGCARDYKVLYPYRYALTLTVVADGAPHTCMNVVQVERHVRPAPDGAGVGAILGVVVAGGANVLDFGRARPLIAQLTRAEAVDEPRPPLHWDILTPEPVLARLYGITPDFGWDEQRGSPMLEALARAEGEHEIGLDDLPTLVTRAEPGAGKRDLVEVDPYDLAATFGPGVAIRRATLGVTRRMITLSHFQRIESARLAPTLSATWKPVSPA